MNVTGILHAKFDTQVVSEKFSKREFVLVIADNPQYPQHIAFQLTQDKVTLIDAFAVGDQLDVSFNLRGRAWTSPQGETRYFNTIEAWKIARVGSATPASSAYQQPQYPSPVKPADEPFGESDDLPF